MTEPATPERRPADEELDYYGLTHPGLVRKVNQDHFLVGILRKRLEVQYTSLPDLDQRRLGDQRLASIAMVADGVGGGNRGEEASRLALEHATAYIGRSLQVYYGTPATESDFMDALQEAALECHAEVVKAARENPELEGMATTLTLWLGVWPWIYLLQVGDSRYYLYRDGTLTQVTRDQTMAEEMVAEGVFTRSQALKTRWAHVLSSSIGGSQTVPVVTRVPARWGSIHLLCSDGLTKHVTDAQIKDVLASMTSARQGCERLLELALEGGGSDNITIVIGRTLRKDRPSGSAKA
jgi:serine/threonine protein phosphatase PrpC